MNQEILHERARKADKRHQAEFDKYVRMLGSGFTRGRFYTPEQLEKQLAKADQALEESKAAYRALGMGDDDQEETATAGE